MPKYAFAVADAAVECLLPPDDGRILYLHLPQRHSIAHKRDIGVHEATHNFLCFMDDDDLYTPHSVLWRVKILMTYNSAAVVQHAGQSRGCVGCQVWCISPSPIQCVDFFGCVCGNA